MSFMPKMFALQSRKRKRRWRCFFIPSPFNMLLLSVKDPEISAGDTSDFVADEEGMTVYLKPVNYYGILQDRATVKRRFLARGLSYKLQERHKKKVQLSVSISEASGDKIHTKTICPLYILLAREVPTPNGETLQSSSYKFKKVIKLTASDGSQAKFILPEIIKLSAEVNDGSFSVLLVSGADHTNLNEMDRSKDQTRTQSFASDCVMGKVRIDKFLHLTCNNPELSLGVRHLGRSVVSMQSCRMKVTFPDVVTFQFSRSSESVSILEQRVVVTAQEVGATAIDDDDMLTNFLEPGSGLKPGEVNFKYKGYNDIVCMTDVMRDYSCPFCCLACASYKGLKCHLQASHDLFDFEFQEYEKYQAVNVSYNKTDAFSPQSFGILYSEDKNFCFCRTAFKRKQKREDQTQLADHVGHVTLGLITPPTTKVLML